MGNTTPYVGARGRKNPLLQSGRTLCSGVLPPKITESWIPENNGSYYRPRNTDAVLQDNDPLLSVNSIKAVIQQVIPSFKGKERNKGLLF